MSTPDFSAAVAHALSHPSPWPSDIRAVIEGETFDPPPWNIVKGPIIARGGSAGAITLHGKIIATWGDTQRADMVFSVTKSYIGLLAAVALDRGLIADFAEPVSGRVVHEAFSGPRNGQITWHQLLQQTSEWQGTLWGIPDTVDRDRQLAPTDDPARFNRCTPLKAPGTYWDYNDARVNALCLALTILFEKSLEDVLAEVLPPFADRTAWRWHGYGEASTIRIADRPVEVTVGGGHWGGGLSTSIDLDLVLAELVLCNGTWKGRQVIFQSALDKVFAPCALQPIYGGLWWLNTERRLFSTAPTSSVFALGVGLNMIWIDRSLGLTAALHWIDEAALPGFVELVMAAIS